ncbi:MAG: cation:proton antiporter [Deltaproteobacteria bacterium]|nr:cation:proton antiporter [Deltaproteobacteria bacterium]
MELVLSILIILIAARIFGEIAEKLGQSSIIGQIIAGVILGPSVLNIIVPSPDTESLAMLGIFFLMFIAGMEIDPTKMIKTGKVTSAIAAGGVIFPLIFGISLGLLVGAYFIPGFTFIHALILGVCLSISAVGVIDATLMELGKIKTDIGQIIIEAGILDDIIGLLMLSIITSIIKAGIQNAIYSVTTILVDMVIFFALFTFIGVFIFPRLLRFARGMKSPQSLFGIAIILAILYSLSSEYMLGSGIIGAFMAGIFTRHAVERHRDVERGLLEKFSAIAFSLLTPLFFVWIGIQMSPGILAEFNLLIFSILVIIVAIAGKLIGAYVPARLSGLKPRESLAVSFGMNARGAVELVIAGIALQSALIGQELFSIIVVMALVTTIIAPAGMERFLKKSKMKLKL